MPSVSEILDQVGAFLAHRLSLEQLEDWSAEYSWNIHQRADRSTQALAYRLCAILDAYSDDASDAAVREELAVAILPFLVPRVQYCVPEDRLEPIAETLAGRTGTCLHLRYGSNDSDYASPPSEYPTGEFAFREYARAV